jgi:hypothetical protein
MTENFSWISNIRWFLQRMCTVWIGLLLAFRWRAERTKEYITKMSAHLYVLLIGRWFKVGRIMFEGSDGGTHPREYNIRVSEVQPPSARSVELGDKSYPDLCVSFRYDVANIRRFFKGVLARD